MESKQIIIFFITLILIAIISFFLGKQFNDTSLETYPQRGILAQDIMLKDYRLIFDPVETNTNSMSPTFGKGNTLLVSKDTASLHVGDIVGFGDEVFVTYHRIIEIGEDGLGWYAVTRGDNNHMTLVEEKEIRKNEILFVVEGILY